MPPQELSLPQADQRLASLSSLVEERRGEIDAIPFTDEVNNHVHTIYSFSPYSPSAAAWMARQAGLRAVGSVDHDSIAAASETREACALLGIGATSGCEVRVNFTGTPVEGRRINNPDSPNLAYIVFHGVPARSVPEVDAFLAPIRKVRNRRNQSQTERMSVLLQEAGGPAVAFDDVIASSMAHQGGGITERHILYVASRALMDEMQPGASLVSFVEEKLTGPLGATLRDRLADASNPHYVYDLLGALKSSFLPHFFEQPTEEECVHVTDAVTFANSIDAIPAYAYLGDVGESPTGDKKAAVFEDSYLDELFPLLREIGFRAVTYMPPRNTKTQLLRVQALCSAHGLMEISGVDINSSRQLFTCPEILDTAFRHLIDSTWALIVHEKLADHSAELSLFSPDNPHGGSLSDRLEAYADIGRKMDHSDPDSAISIAGA